MRVKLQNRRFYLNNNNNTYSEKDIYIEKNIYSEEKNWSDKENIWSKKKTVIDYPVWEISINIIVIK